MLSLVPSWLIRLLVAIVVIILAAIVVSALGGFDWHLVTGHFHWDLGVTK